MALYRLRGLAANHDCFHGAGGQVDIAKSTGGFMLGSKFTAIIGVLSGALFIGAASAAALPEQDAPIWEKMRASGVDAPSPTQECMRLRESAKEGMIVEDDFILSGGEIELRLVLSAPSSMAPKAASAGLSIACLLAKSEDQRWPTSVSMLASYREGRPAMREAPEDGILAKAAEAMAFANGSNTANAQRELRACFKKAAAKSQKSRYSKISLGDSGPGGELGISCGMKRERGEGLIFHAEMSTSSSTE